jgi:hypothetical protein
VTPCKLVALSLSPQQIFFALFVDDDNDSPYGVFCDNVETGKQ